MLGKSPHEVRPVNSSNRCSIKSLRSIALVTASPRVAGAGRPSISSTALVARATNRSTRTLCLSFISSMTSSSEQNMFSTYSEVLRKEGSAEAGVFTGRSQCQPIALEFDQCSLRSSAGRAEIERNEVESR